MNQDLYQVIQSIQAYVYRQERKIQKLQKTMAALEQKISELQNRPPIKVERMEYKFDQLKVETLEGTLNIGLNPSDLQGIEDLSIPNQNGAHAPREGMAMFTEIEDALRQYLDTNLHLIMENAGNQLQFEADTDTYREFILQDIKKQLPNRIEHYLNQPLRSETESPQQQKERIIEQLKKEIDYGVLTFLQNLPENMKGKRKE